MSYPTLVTTPGLRAFMEAVDVERQRQLSKWGDQRHPDGTGRPGDQHLADYFRTVCQANDLTRDNWRDIAAEEVFEAFAETDPEKLGAEIVQTAAVLAAWWDDIRRRTNRGRS